MHEYARLEPTEHGKQLKKYTPPTDADIRELKSQFERGTELLGDLGVVVEKSPFIYPTNPVFGKARTV